MNSVYNEPFKACFKFTQCVGVIGGKPNHAYYFIGFYGDNLLYLDPHTTQQAVFPEKMSQIPDESYHCNYPSRMNISDLDPSIALGFFCNTEEEFDDLCAQFHEHILSGQRRPMFELAIERPPHWPSLEIPPRPGDELNCSTQSDFTELNYESDEDKDFDTDGEYEILSLQKKVLPSNFDSTTKSLDDGINLEFLTRRTLSLESFIASQNVNFILM